MPVVAVALVPFAVAGAKQLPYKKLKKLLLL